MPQVIPAFIAAVKVVVAKVTIKTVVSFAIKVAVASVIKKLSQVVTKPTGTGQEQSRSNVRLSTPIRWLACGEVRMGGGVIMGEYASSRSFWAVFAHCDSELVEVVDYYLDDVRVNVDSNNNANHPDFTLNGNRYFLIYTTTFTQSNPVPPPIAQLATELPSFWTTDHKMTGVTYSALRCLPISIKDRHKMYRWRGVFGLGEPALSIVGKWGRVYDPRDPSQDVNNRSTWKYSNNMPLVWAWFRTHPYGRNTKVSDINWIEIATEADIADQLVPKHGGGSERRYTCNVAVADDVSRFEYESIILASANATIHFDGEGRVYCKVARYETPSVTLNRKYDLLGIEIQGNSIAEENSYQGVVVRYTDPNSRYEPTMSAPWKNPKRYVEGSRASFLTVDIPTIHNHNQAYRIAKILGQQFQGPYNVSAVVGLRGLKTSSERVLNLDFDDEVSGSFELLEPVEVDISGSVCTLVAFPVTEDAYTLAVGEEPEPPSNINTNSALTIDNILYSLVQNNTVITINYIPVLGLEYEFQYRLSTSNTWLIVGNFNDSSGLPQLSGLTLGAEYEFRGRSASGFSSETSEWVNVGVTMTNVTIGGSPGDGTEGVVYSFTFTQTNAVNPTFGLFQGVLPNGLTLNSTTGEILGTPSVGSAGTYSSIIVSMVTLGVTVVTDSFNIEIVI